MPEHNDSKLKRANRKTVEAQPDFDGNLKHAARHLLWLPEAQLLRREKGRHLKYFTLPGKWAYDIFFFESNDIVLKEGRGFPGVRFCDNNPRAFSDAKQRLGNTIGKLDDFEHVVLNYDAVFWDGFPYDIYNLDFCGTCLPDDQPPFSDTFLAIDRIINEHADQEEFPFAIFLTIKALGTETNSAAKDDLMNNIESNRLDSNFAQRIDDVIPNTKDFMKNRFVDFILISIPKVVCHLSRNRCNLEIKSRAKYRRYNVVDGEYYITKFVFKFTIQNRIIIDPNPYINNVLSVLDLRNILTINNSLITTDIRRSGSALRRYVKGL